jgi:sec-independent protein translocase protein TatB
MFDIGASELGVVFVVSLIVLGPKRLPGLVKKVGRWVGKARSMARDFQQQLENEVNLEELNKMTQLRTSEAQSIMPSPPEPGADPSTVENPGDTPSYPYSVQSTPASQDSSAVESTSAEVVAADAAQTDDTYSHAHSAGDAPMPDVAEHSVVESTYAEEPVQADLDLSQPEDDSHLPPDDARRYS